jgi:Ca2+-binding RTX toxin-like protein
MPTVDFTNLGINFSYSVSGTADYAGFINSSSISYTWISTSGHVITASGTGISVNGSNIPISGSINTITINLSGSSTAQPDLVIDDLDLDLTSFDFSAGAAANNTFWANVLAGETSVIPPVGQFQSGIGGDFLNLSGSDTNFGSDDMITGADQSVVVGDAVALSDSTTLIAGDDTFTGSFFGAYGDVFNAASTSRLFGGNDTIVLTLDHNTTGSVIISGDAISVADSAMVIGGDDILDARVVVSANNQVFGDVQNITGNAVVVGGDDTLYGGNSTTGTNILFGDASFINSGFLTGGDDTLFGGDGIDLIYGDYQTNIGGTIVSGGDDILHGGSGNDILVGNEGNDQLFGGDDNDFLIFDEDPNNRGDLDIWDGGEGVDNAAFGGFHSAVRVNLLSSNEVFTRDNTSVSGPNPFRVIVEMENIENITGTNFSDQLWGDNENNLIFGGVGHDDLRGEGGDDTLLGGDGNDFLFGRQGADTMSGGAGNDRIVMDSLDTSVNGGADFDRVSVAGSGGVNLNMTLSEIERAAGNSGNDTFDATGKNDFRVIIQGNGGSDRLLGGELADTIAGGAQSDTLFGNEGADRLFGEAGSDVLNGGLGRDKLSGGVGGFDIFEFNADWDRDSISDFGVGMDKIRFDGVTDSAGGTLEFSDLELFADSAGNALVRVTGVSANDIRLLGVDFNDLSATDFEFV